jgi:hypothetical protein
MRSTIIGLAVLASTVACAASAQTVSGTFDPSQSGPYLDIYLPFSGGSGVYQVSMDLSRPGSGFLELGYTTAFDWFGLQSGQWYGGDDHPVAFQTWFDPPTHHLVESISVPENYTVIYPPGWFPEPVIEYNTFYNQHAWLDVGFEGVTPVDYTLTATRVGDVPEPAAWTLLIAGFGLCGALLRRQRAAAA